MNLYKVDPSKPYLETVAKFIIENFNDLSHLKVILPSGSACNHLYKLLMMDKKACLLPQITTFYNSSIEGEVTLIDDLNLYNVLKPLEEKIILAEIITIHSDLNLTIDQALNLAPSLAHLFRELIFNNVDIEHIRDLPLIEQAQHWHNIYKFLIKAYKAWQDKLASLGKIDLATYQINLWQGVVNYTVVNHDHKLLVAGITGCNNSSTSFLKDILSLTNVYYIAPPMIIDERVLDDSPKEPEDDSLFCFKKLLSALGVLPKTFKEVGEVKEQTHIFDELIFSNISSLKKPIHNKVQYLESENIFSEANNISLLCLKYLSKTPSNKIAIILNNSNYKDIYLTHLNKYDFRIHDSIGLCVAESDILKLIYMIGNFITNKFDIQKLLILVKNKLINDKHAFTLELLLSKKLYRFINSWPELSAIAQAQHEDDFYIWLQIMQKTLSPIEENNFANILKKTIAILEELCPNIWQTISGHKIYDLILMLTSLSWQQQISPNVGFSELISKLIVDYRITSDKINDYQIIICAPQEAILHHYDLIILADFNETSWPKIPYINPWLSKQLERELKLYNEQVKTGDVLYNFYVLLHSHTIISRALKTDKVNSLASSYLLKMKFILAKYNYIIDNLAQMSLFRQNKMFENVNQPTLDYSFPKQISVTDIELLIRNPYSFYAKKILNLKPLSPIADKPKISEFGSFVHEIIEQYSRNYYKNSADTDNKINQFISIAKNHLENSFLPTVTKKIWALRIIHIAKDFIEFDDKRRFKNIKVYTEIKGEMLLPINEHSVKIIAIADRIEIDSSNCATILDYKTGSLPTQKDVMSGLSPQLLIEAMILKSGGFNIRNVRSIDKIVYVKIASSAPYIRIVEIDIDDDLIENHLNGLKNLLSYYIKTSNYNKEINMAKYNDYKHLARKL